MQMGLHLELIPADSLETRTIETAPEYLELMRKIRAVSEQIDLDQGLADFIPCASQLMILQGLALYYEPDLEDLDLKAILLRMKQS
jgi:hypothetical protein